MYEKEKVLVVPSEVVEKMVDGKTGFIKLPFSRVLVMLSKADFAPRNQVEEDPNYRQIIPYLVTRHLSNLIMFRRKPKAGEKRLHGMLSFPGGHINMSDMVGIKKTDKTDMFDVFWNGTYREFNEEIDGIPLSWQFEGIIKSDATEVDKVHLGVILSVNIGDYKGVKEEEKYEAIVDKPEAFKQYLSEMETWAKLAYENVVLAK